MVIEGAQLHTWIGVRVYVEFSAKILDSDLRPIASQLYQMSATRPWTRHVQPCHFNEEDAPPVSRETVMHNRHLHHKNGKAHRRAALTKQSCRPPLTNRVTTSQVKIYANSLIIVAMALT